jgi:periplasmic divalent cation tolerance protein
MEFGIMTGHLQVVTTVASKNEGEQLAADLVDRGLAGCVQVLGPITSVYRWKGKTEHAQEWMCVIKTHENRYQAVEEAITAAHPYDTPEIIATPIVAGSAAYLKWLDEATTSSSE